MSGTKLNVCCLMPLSFPVSVVISVHRRPSAAQIIGRGWTPMNADNNNPSQGHPNEVWRFNKDAGKLCDIGNPCLSFAALERQL